MSAEPLFKWLACGGTIACFPPLDIGLIVWVTFQWLVTVWDPMADPTLGFVG